MTSDNAGSRELELYRLTADKAAAALGTDPQSGLSQGSEQPAGARMRN